MKLTGSQLSLGLQLLMWIVLLIAGFLFLSAFYSWHTALLYTCIHNILSVILFYGNNFFVNRLVEKKKYWLYGLLFVIVAVAAILFRIRLSYLASQVLASGSPILSTEARVKSFAVITTVPILILSFFFQLLTNRFKTEKKYLSLINQHNEAQLQFLKAQINPHFLFNTLNNIYALSVIKSEQTPKMILLLSDLLRYVIYDSQQAKVALTIEIVQVEKFIELFQMRQEQPLAITFEISGNPTLWQIEPMILMPLVENCFKHCDFEMNEKAFTRIDLKTSPDELVFMTCNTKNDQYRQKDQTGGVGLENIRKRLALQYENRYELLIDNQDTTFFVQLTLKISA